MTDDRERWNAKYRAGEAQAREPDALLVETCSDLPPGYALDLAGGAGRHAIWLARRGWHVLLTDVSDEALAIAARRSAEEEAALTFRCEPADATVAWAARYREDFDIRFDLILVFWCLVREQFGELARMLAPGGMLIYKTFTTDHARFATGARQQYALMPGELRTAFPGLDTMIYREEVGVAELVARAR